MSRSDQSAAAGRTLLDGLFALGAFAAAGLSLGLFLVGLGLIAHRGGQVLSLAFVTRPMTEGGLSGGIADQIAGTAMLLITMLAIVLPLSMAVALWHRVYLTGRAHQLLTTALYAANGIPSVIFGIFGFWLFVLRLGWGKSWLAGGLLLAMMVLPMTALTLSEGMRRIPADYLQQAEALGLARSAVIWSVLIPQSLASFVSGILLGLARAAGETAPIMFTATVFSGASWPRGIRESPVLSLPYHIFNLAQDSYHPQALRQAWGAACVLIAICVGLNLLALPCRLRLHEEARS